MGRLILILCLLAGGGPVARAAPWPWLQGELSGELIVNGPGGFPPLRWTLRAQPDARGNTAQLKVTAPGLQVEALVVGPDAGGGFAWRVTEGEVDLAPWWRRLAQSAGVEGMPADLTLSGTVKLGGEGTWRGDGWAGRLQASIANGAAVSEAQNWSVPGFEAAVALAGSGESLIVQSLTLRAAEATALDVALRNLELTAEGDAPNRLLITSAGVDALGGRIALKPFAVDPLNPVIETTAEMAGVSLAQLADLVPQALKEASGQVSGRVEVKWSASLGPKTGAGALTVTPDSSANFRLAATPGFLTQHAPERIQLLPDKLGALARWLSLENPAYETLRRIELGEMPLQVEDLSIELYPDGPAGPRSAAVRVTARPADGSVVDKVTFAVNVSGPLDQVLKLGTSDGATLSFGTKP